MFLLLSVSVQIVFYFIFLFSVICVSYYLLLQKKYIINFAFTLTVNLLFFVT